ncbi:MAG: 16S rRNA (adenine(1518)-N(6)/adenine(1519)-N(6))-dimethyltransferase RsmA [Planctomycetaceae bacterium]
MSYARQTVSYLQKRFAEVGIRPESRYGQNFLIDLNLIDLLVDAAKIGPQDVVLEIGTGMGSLTTKMATMAGAVVTVEIDSRVFQLASEELDSFGNVTMLLVDALKNKNSFAQEVIDAVHQNLAAIPGSQLKLAANLPYNVATPILSNLLLFDPVPVSLTATIQKELAERIAAPVGTKDYSALSIWMQALCDVEIVRILPPQVFWPRPKVHSAIIQLAPSAEKRAQIRNLDFFHAFVRALFLHRRKFLRGVLCTLLKEVMEKPDVDELISELEYPVDCRAEQLPVEEFLRLAEVVEDRVGTDWLG